jgi:hypothetical protein
MALQGLLIRFLVQEAAVGGCREVLAAIERAEATIAAAVASAAITGAIGPDEAGWSRIEGTGAAGD